MEDTATNGRKQDLKGVNTPSIKHRKTRYLPGLPSVSSTQDQQAITYSMTVDKTATEFNALDNYEIFAMASDGSHLMVKVSKSKAVRLNDRKTYMTNGGRVHRVTLQAHCLDDH